MIVQASIELKDKQIAHSTLQATLIALSVYFFLSIRRRFLANKNVSITGKLLNNGTSLSSIRD